MIRPLAKPRGLPRNAEKVGPTYFECFSLPILPKEEQVRLCLAFQSGDKRAGDKLIRHSMRAIVAIVQPIARVNRERGSDVFEDLVSVATAGFLAGMRKWKAAGGANVVNYCSMWVGAYIRKHVMDNLHLVRFSTQQLRKDYWQATNEHLEQHSKMGDLARAKLSPLSLERSMYAEDGTDSTAFKDAIESAEPTPEEAVGDAETLADRRGKFAAAFQTLDAREQTILRMRLLSQPPKSLTEVGAEFDLSRERARQIEKSATEKLLSALGVGMTVGELRRRRAQFGDYVGAYGKRSG